MELKTLKIKKEMMNELSSNPKLSRLNFLLLYNSQIVENEYYINSVSKTLNSLGIKHSIVKSSDFEEMKNILKNSDEYSSILLARPTGFINEDELLNLIPIKKDVDMLTTSSMGNLLKGDINFLPATAKSVAIILEKFNIQVASKKALIIGRSISVGSPIALLLLKLNAHISIVHSRTSIDDIKKEAKQSDIIVLASGKRLLDANDIKDNAVIIDCGYNKDGQGDLGFIPTNASFTPVPGGVGPLTTIAIVLNALYLFENLNWQYSSL